MRLWSRRGTNLTSRFPILAAAAARQLPQGLVLDGALVILDGRLSFDALQRRLVTAPAKARKLVASTPASYVADLGDQRYSHWR